MTPAPSYRVIDSEAFSAATRHNKLAIPVFSMYSGSRYGTMTLSKYLVAASANPLILSILSQGKSYGYAILLRVKEISGGEIAWTDGMLYPVLHRLERKGFIQAEWRMAESGRRRKYYRITAPGLAQLERERTQWMSVHTALVRVWEDTG